MLYERGKLSAALEVIERGLALSPKDSKLMLIGAWSHLRMSESDPTKLRDAEVWFDRVWRLADPKTDEGQKILMAIRQKQTKEYFQRLKSAGFDDRITNGRVNPALLEVYNPN